LPGFSLLVLCLNASDTKKLENADPGPDWRETEERFIDPETKECVTVVFNPTSGERRYVAKSNPGS
jgi:hypothetical protein